MSIPLIEYCHVTVRRGGRPALDDLTLSIHEGEHVAILGPNGSGKSTLIKTITRELYPALRDGSYLRILGQESWNVFELRSMLGIVTNDLMQSCTREFPFTGREIVLSGFFSSIGVWPWHEITDVMRGTTGDVLRRLEIEHLADRMVDEMSSGEQRRVLIARALVHAPKALVLDEPSTSLDLRAMHELRDIMRRIAAEGTSIVLVTHHLPDLIPEIERVILLDKGRVLRDGPKQDVLTSEALSQLFGAEVELVQRDGYYHVW